MIKWLRQGLAGAAARNTSLYDAAELEEGIKSLDKVRLESGQATAAQIVADYKALGLTKQEIDQTVTLKGIQAERYRFDLRMQQLQQESEFYALLGAEELALRTTRKSYSRNKSIT